MLQALADHGITLGDFTIPWSWVFLLGVIIVGLLLVRTAITLVKVGIIVAIGFGIWLLVEYLLNNFT